MILNKGGAWECANYYCVLFYIETPGTIEMVSIWQQVMLTDSLTLCTL